MKNNFEEAMERLEKLAEKVGSPEVSLEEAIASYKVGIKEYETCKKILEEAKQEIVMIEEE